MKNTQEFRERLGIFIAKKYGSQLAFSKASGIPQPILSRFLSGKGMAGKHILTAFTFLQKMS